MYNGHLNPIIEPGKFQQLIFVTKMNHLKNDLTPAKGLL